MAHRLKPLAKLRGDQLRASSPRDHAALSASAGTGKTHVLTARVLRLLLSRVEPSSILCLTFTKAAAAEMAHRIHERLAHWVRLKDADLAADLAALGEDVGPATRERARTLFARVLDAPGGGLRIQTIHAFAQSLLASFPAEAGLVPGFRPLEEREQQLLARSALAGLLVRAEGQGDLGLVADMQAMSLRLGEGDAESFLMQCARAPDALTGLGPREGIEARLRHAFGIPLGDVEEAIAAACMDEIVGLRQIARHNADWSAKAGQERASICEQWLAATPPDRAAMLEDLHLVWAKKDGEIRSFGRGQAPPVDAYPELASAAFECCHRLLQIRRTATLVRELAAGLRAGQAFALAYGDAKRAQGAADFDDLIRWAEQLLRQDGMGDWVRYKLDQATDHILVDEAQDTNEPQWNIVRALTLEYFAGEGASSRHRTIFTVGDFKQAIFGFQGTNPESFDVARRWFDREARAVERDFLDLSMDRSFRSSPPVLALVDKVIGELGHKTLGLPRAPNPHEAHHESRAGSVTLWQPYTEDAAEEEADEGEEGWVSDAVRNYATKLARQVRRWLDRPFMVAGKGRPLRPEDILILVRRRGTLASLIVARLHAEGVPVAGVDRLLLTAPLAVKDLLAAARFAMQPLDDLNLAGLLVSPLFGWSQDDLYTVAAKRGGSLWQAVRESGPSATADGLGSILAMADYATPHQFLETILSGPMQARRKLLERLGPEARDPVEELLSSALEFESAGTPTLERFLDWFARGDVEIVRDPSAPLDAVRVMTVHGSKGLQSPVLILADACLDPQRQRGGSARLQLDENSQPIPIFRPRKAELVEPLRAQVEARDARDREEHWRLLYVALTRAEERLFIGGALGPADRNGPPEESWYAAIERAMRGLGSEWHEDGVWGRSCNFGDGVVETKAAVRTATERSAELPAWLFQPAPPEARPPRPFTPSAPEDDSSTDPPPSHAMRAAAERGKLLHRLFERMPGVPVGQRAALADAWLERAAGVSNATLRRELVETAAAIIDRPDLADLFGPDALAEAPIAAVTREGAVVSGTVDRLLVAPDRIRLVDFKTGRAVPSAESAIPIPHLRQMAAYVAALEVIFLDRPIEATLLYTSGPQAFGLNPDLLARYRPSIVTAA